jgi:hypothetical protein
MVRQVTHPARGVTYRVSTGPLKRAIPSSSLLPGSPGGGGAPRVAQFFRGECSVRGRVTTPLVVVEVSRSNRSRQGRQPC